MHSTILFGLGEVLRIALVRFGIQHAPVFNPALALEATRRETRTDPQEGLEARRVLVIGRHPFGSTSASRLSALKVLFPDVQTVDTQPFLEHLPLGAHFLANHAFAGPAVRVLNQRVREVARSFQPDLVWVDRGLHLWPETLQSLRSSGSRYLLHFSPDSHQILGNQSRHFIRGIRFYDVIVTTKPRDVPSYEQAGARRVELLEKAFDPAIHRPVPLSEEDRERYESDVVFIGHWEPFREVLLRSLVDQGYRLKVWGGGWQKAKPHPLFRHNPHLIGDEYAKAIAGGKIHLCLLSKLAGDQSTARSVEIPASGRFLLAERTAEHQALFREGVEAEFYASPEEMKQKLDYYLCHPNERERIAAAGRARCLAGYSNEQRLRELFHRLKGAPLCAVSQAS